MALKIRDYGDIMNRAALVERDIEDSQRRQSLARGDPIWTGAGSSGIQRATPYHRPDQTVEPRAYIARGAGGVPKGVGTNLRSCFACRGATHIRIYCQIYSPPRNTQTTGPVQADRPPLPRLLLQHRSLGTLAPGDATQRRVFALTHQEKDASNAVVEGIILLYNS